MHIRSPKQAISYAICYIILCAILCYVAANNTTTYNNSSCVMADAFGYFMAITIALVVGTIPGAAILLFFKFSKKQIPENISDSDWRIVISGILGMLLIFWFVEFSRPYDISYKVWAHKMLTCVDYKVPIESDVDVLPSEQ